MKRLIPLVLLMIVAILPITTVSAQVDTEELYTLTVEDVQAFMDVFFEELNPEVWIELNYMFVAWDFVEESVPPGVRMQESTPVSLENEIPHISSWDVQDLFVKTLTTIDDELSPNRYPFQIETLERIASALADETIRFTGMVGDAETCDRVVAIYNELPRWSGCVEDDGAVWMNESQAMVFIMNFLTYDFNMVGSVELREDATTRINLSCVEEDVWLFYATDEGFAAAEAEGVNLIFLEYDVQQSYDQFYWNGEEATVSVWCGNNTADS